MNNKEDDKTSIEEIFNSIKKSAKKVYQHKFNKPNIKKWYEEAEEAQAELEKEIQDAGGEKLYYSRNWRSWELGSKIKWCLFWYFVFFIPSLFITTVLLMIVVAIFPEVHHFNQFILSVLLDFEVRYDKLFHQTLMYTPIINYFITIKIVKWSIQ